MMRNWQNLSLFTQLALPLSILLVGAIGVIALFSIWSQTIQITEALASEAIVAVDLVESATATPLLDLDVSRLREIMNQPTASWDIARIYGQDGRLLVNTESDQPSFSASPDPEGLRLLEQADIEIQELPDRIIVTKPVQVGNQHLGAVALEFFTQDVIQSRNVIITQSLILAFVLVAISLFVIFYLGRSFTQSTRVLIQATQEIGGGNLAFRTELPGTDELNTIGTALNVMVARLEQATIDLEKRTQSLIAAERARVRSEEANKAKSSLLAKISHDLRTPLGGILGQAELIYGGILGDVPVVQRESLAQIIQSVHYLTALINDLLDQAKLESGDFSIRPRSFAIAEFAESVIAKVELHAGQESVKLETNIDPNLPETLILDDIRLQQISINLLNNAIKFANQGTVRWTLSQTSDNFLLVQVEDNGLGISEEEQRRIFEPFTQVGYSVTNTTKGFGLGLSIVKQLVELMGGNIQLDSKLGRGSTFSARIPFHSEV